MSANHTNLGKATAAWPGMPEWVRLLAEACDRVGQTAVANRLGYSSGTVSRIVNARYPGDLVEAEKQVRAAFGAEIVACPVFGDMPLRNCLSLRRRKPGANLRDQLLARACPDCTNNTDREEE